MHEPKSTSTYPAQPADAAPPLRISKPLDYCIVAAIMGLMGAFFWAIRGTAGFGGSQGGLLAGLGWGLLWLAFSHRGQDATKRPYATPWMLAAITFGIAYGGLTGYGVYIQWIQGKFYLNFPEGGRDIGPWTGYAMLFFCGLHWGGVTGAFMAWCGPNAALRWFGWVLRIASGVIGAALALYIVRTFPHWFLPFYAEGIYEIEENRTCIRAAGSIRNIAPHVGFFFGFLAFEIARRDWRAVSMMLVMGLGFAIPFTVGGYWQTFYLTVPDIDWWKKWEMTIGLGGGLAMGLAFYFFNRPAEDAPPRRISAKACVLGTAFPIWFALGIVFRNTFRGYTNIHDINVPDHFAIWFSLIYLAPASIAFALFIRNTYAVEKRVLAMLTSVFLIVLFLLALYRTPFLYLLPATILLGLILYRPKAHFDTLPFPDWVFLGGLKMIVVAGLIVSIPQPLQLLNYILLTLYIIYLSSSALLFFWLLRRSESRT